MQALDLVRMEAAVLYVLGVDRMLGDPVRPGYVLG
jgi:hypothetical protein